MKHALICALILAVLAISGCSTVSDDGLSIRLSADPSPIFSGSDTIVSVDTDNRNDRSINDVRVEVFDAGMLTGSNCAANYPRLLSYEFQTFSCTFRAPSVLDSIDTEINARALFKSSLTASQVFDVISEAEYNRRRSVGSFTPAQKTYTYADRYIRLDVEFSDSPPLVIAPDKKYFVYFTITNTGGGFLQSIDRGEFRLMSTDSDLPPVTIECPDIASSLIPSGKSFPRLACEIIVPNNYFSVRSFKSTGFIVQLDYEYELRGRLPISIVK